ncbi:DUF3182 family protein [Allopusillimonas soli]|uniref:DUF3182 family protein n=1 Tax=Allopusillimonas soli TaxID=659016 RepID=A0A853FG82_9BURK|nr:DUF3182 family protein [Allopusillimonas soli]NYT38678.1 DUF3182 family protein [Allopusillimonas soli]TEA71618.1 DUF3182 family protein [Allopusillimonas soli]
MPAKPGRAASGVVLVYSAREREPEHEAVVHALLGQRIAALLELDFGGTHEAGRRYEGRTYLLPTETLIGDALARRLGVGSETDLFGGAAPYPFVPTKAISHALLDGNATAPQGWSKAFGSLIHGAVLRGVTAFSSEDAMRAGRMLLRHGPVRIKPVLATGGRGQVVVEDETALRDALDQADTQSLNDCGLVLEENLREVDTFSVGQVRVDGQKACYVGRQSLTPDNQGEMVYGGSELLVVRGSFDRLLTLDLDQEERLAISMARQYDQAAMSCFPGLLASRRNYDVACGWDSAGRRRSGVLEQSWRMGGASAAEIAALQAFKADPALHAVRAATIEIFGADAPAPAGAECIYRGYDPEMGMLSKYVTVRAYDNQQHQN